MFAVPDAAALGRVKKEVFDALVRWEPRIQVIDVDVEAKGRGRGLAHQCSLQGEGDKQFLQPRLPVLFDSGHRRMIQAPKIDERDSRDLSDSCASCCRATRRTGRKAPRRCSSPKPWAHVFARFGEIVIDRLNRVPEKNFLAFLQLLGVSNLPPRAAQAPLTFYLAGQGADFAVVPAQTQVAAQPLKGEKDPVLFETDRELVVVSTKFTSLFVKDGKRDLYSDLSRLLPAAPPAAGAAPAQSTSGLPMFTGDTPIPHLFYVGLSAPLYASPIDRIVVTFALKERESSAARLAMSWNLHLPPASKPPARGKTPETIPLEALLTSGVAIKPVKDATEGLRHSGEVIFENVPPSPSHSVQGEQLYWLGGRLLTPIIDSADSAKVGNATVKTRRSPSG